MFKNIKMKIWENEHNREHIILLVSVIIISIFISTINPRFLTYTNLVNIFQQISIYLILAVGLTLIMTTGGIDVSTGAILGLSTCVIGLSLKVWYFPVWLTVLVGLLAGALCGFFNGLLVTKIKLPPIITTIATLNIFRGIAYIMVGDNIYYRFPATFRNIAQAKFLNIPMQVYIASLVAILGYIFLKYHYLGRYTIAVGANPEAARLAGIDEKRVKIIIYTLSGLMGGLAAIIMTAKLDSAQAVAGLGMELHIIAVVVIGGTSLFGGYGTIIGTIMGTFLIGILENSLIIMNVNYHWQLFVLGSMIVAAVAFRTLGKHYKGTIKEVETKI